MKNENYITPETLLCDLEIEAALCATSQQSFDSLQDYTPSQGIW